MKLKDIIKMKEFSPSYESNYWDKSIINDIISYKLRNNNLLEDDVATYYSPAIYSAIPEKIDKRYEKLENNYRIAIQNNDWEKFKKYTNKCNYKPLLPQNYISVYSCSLGIEIGKLEITENTFSMMEEILNIIVDWNDI